MEKQSALDLTVEQWKSWLSEQKAPKYAAKQILQWLFHKGVLDPMQFSNLSLSVREKLSESFFWDLPEIDSIDSSTQHNAEKILIRHEASVFSECVLMVENKIDPDGINQQTKRVTLCVSSQVGCKLGCTFCQTGKMGFKRNLTSGEILAQILIANRRLEEKGIPHKVRNVVFMGMGEPLDNYDAVVQACSILIDPDLFGLSKHRVTVSTSGLVPEIEKLGQELPVSLAISLHSAVDEKRSQIMPVNRKYPLADLKRALLNYPHHTRHGVTFEYIMIRDLNDTISDAKQLVKFLHGFKAKVNLIPMNPHPASDMQPSTEQSIRSFQKYLQDRSYVATVRYSRGGDVSAACGQLAAKRRDEFDLTPRLIRLKRKNQLSV